MNPTSSVAFATVALVDLALFVWALRRHFARTESRQRWALTGLEGAFALAVAIGGAALTTADVVPLVAWLPLGASLGLFVWTWRTTLVRPPSLAFSRDRPEHLYELGPYRLVRHPFYVSYLLFFVALAVAAPGLGTLGALVAMTVCYWRAAAAEERKFAVSGLGVQYAHYRARVGRFVPRWPRGSCLP